MNVFTASAIATIVTAWLIFGVRTNAEAASLLVNLLIPLSWMVGLGGLWVGCRDIWRARRLTLLGSACLVLGSTVIAWSHIGVVSSIRRAATVAGFGNAGAPVENDYRIFSLCVLLATCVAGIRWWSRRRFGEWLWLGVFILWALVVRFADPWVQSFLVKVYLTVQWL